MAVEVVSFGCRLNTLEAETMRQKAQESGLSDAILINTCAVTGEAVKQARQTIRRARRENPESRIVVAGCAVQVDPAPFAAMPEVDQILGNVEKLAAASYASAVRIQVGDIMQARENPGQPATGIAGRTRAFVELQTGCDHRCTFCIIPFARGGSRSVYMRKVVDRVRNLVERGYAEVVLTGVDITAWGADLPGTPTLGMLVRAILAEVPELARLRLSSIDSIEVDADLMAAIADEPRLMPHFHLSLQHGDDMILKRMKRRHSRADAIRFADAVRRVRPDVAFSADIIVGFPTETEAMFAQSLSLIDAVGLTRVHVFPFSPRPGTPAARMPQVDGAIIHERAARLRTKGEAAFAAHLAAEQGAVRRLLVENGGVGRTEQFTLTEIAGTPGRFVDARIVGRTARALIAAPLAEAA
jgi:threonylcarbamoyladenosine tRNA methylthiotransferase MtaB